MNRIYISGLAVLLAAVSLLGAVDGALQSDGGELTITGSVNQQNQFVDSNGHVYALAVLSKAGGLEALSGHIVRIKDAVLEQDGQKIIFITDYKIVNE